MPKYLISFPAEAMSALTPADLAAASGDSHAVIEAARAAGAYVFGGGIDASIAPVLVDADGSVRPGTHPGSHLDGGFAVLDLPDRAAAEAWAGRLAAACRCSQELRVFGYDPAS